MSGTQRAPLGELLIQHGGMSEEHLQAALEEQRASGRPLGEIVVERGYVPAPMVAQALATQQGGLTKTEYGYATGWAKAVDERDRALAELRGSAERAQRELESRNAEIERLGRELATWNGLRAEQGGAAGDRDQLQAQVASLEAEVAAARAAAADADALQAQIESFQSEIEAANERAALQERELRELRRELEQAASRADEAQRTLEELREAEAVRPDPWANAQSHVLFLRRLEGYELVERDGPPPPVGEIVEGGTVQRVAALGGMPCAYVID